MSRILNRLSPLLLALVIGIYSVPPWTFISPAFVEGKDEIVPYVVLNDNSLSHIIVIGVDGDVSEAQLCATLAAVADKHQDDPAREYWVSEHMIIRAYLIKDGKRSYFRAGTLYRYIKVRYPVPEKEGRPDRFHTNRWLARFTI